jgi:glycosyltransferase involved in cell wall biosynthesis
MRILIPSDNRDFVGELARAYREVGCDVVMGAGNFELGCADFDVVHFQWPEEYCDWRPPSEARLKEIVDRLIWWSQRTRTIISVHNLFPHGFPDDPQCERLFDAFYRMCTVLLHFSSISRKLVCDGFPGARHDRHRVTHVWNNETTLAKQKGRGDCRASFGIREDEFVVLMLGSFRIWDEIQLFTRAFDLCQVPKKRLLMAGRFELMESAGVRRRLRGMSWRSWLWRRRAVVDQRYLPDEELYRFLDTADVVVVPRLVGLNSGVPSLAMTFGRVVVAPSHGAMPEQLAGTGNPIYESGDPVSFARAIEKAAALDRRQIGEDNRRRAQSNRWEGIVRTCLDSIEAGSPTESSRRQEGSVERP